METMLDTIWTYVIGGGLVAIFVGFPLAVAAFFILLALYIVVYACRLLFLPFAWFLERYADKQMAKEFRQRVTMKSHQ